MLRTFAWTLALAVGISALVALYVVVTGVSARREASALEAFAARLVRKAAIVVRVRGVTNPVGSTDEVIAEGRAHFADHCAVCHGNDGSGDTEMGRGLYPKVPDMRLAATQNLSDAELFYIIENGVRFTGMPAWSTGTTEGEEQSWHLVAFIRHLPAVTPEEVEQMETLNPRSPAEVRQEIEIERFLQGDSGPASEPSLTTTEHTGGHE